MSAEKKVRSSRFTSEMSDALVQAYQKNQHVLVGKFSDSLSNDKKQEAWREVMDAVNAVNPGEKKTVNQVKRRWEDLTGLVKKKGREAHNKELQRLRVTGNGHLEDEDDVDYSQSCTDTCIFNTMEQKIAHILGPETFSGIPGGNDSMDTLVSIPKTVEKVKKKDIIPGHVEADVQEVSVSDCAIAVNTKSQNAGVGMGPRKRQSKTLAQAQLEYFDTTTSYYKLKMEKLELEISLLKEKREVQTTYNTQDFFLPVTNEENF